MHQALASGVAFQVVRFLRQTVRAGGPPYSVGILRSEVRPQRAAGGRYKTPPDPKEWIAMLRYLYCTAL
eukprot:11386744-Karenia_brevis.AAC.1